MKRYKMADCHELLVRDVILDLVAVLILVDALVEKQTLAVRKWVCISFDRCF